MNAATSTSAPDRSAPPPRRLRIVVADDDRDMVLTLRMLLEDEGHEVHGLYRGDEVLPLVKRLRPDAVLLDIAMPEQSGFSIAQDIRAAYYGVNKPLLVAISGEYKRPADQILSHLVGFDHHLTKPCAPEDLLRLLRPLSLPPEAL